MPKDIADLINFLLVEIKNLPNISIFEIIQNAFNKNNLNHLFENKDFIKSLIIILETYKRKESRIESLKLFKDCNIILYGNIDENLKELYFLFKNKIYSSVDHIKTIDLIKQSKCILNFHSIFTYGTHERIFEALYCKTPVISTFSKYLEDEFNDFKSILLYETNNFNKLNEHIYNIKNNYNNIIKNIEYEQEYILTNHTWKNRAKKIIDIIITNNKNN